MGEAGESGVQGHPQALVSSRPTGYKRERKRRKRKNRLYFKKRNKVPETQKEKCGQKMKDSPKRYQASQVVAAQTFNPSTHRSTKGACVHKYACALKSK